jgi:(p)ppGpp synthase/HD superfamily hydrolase
MPNIETAIALAVTAHTGQLDKAGQPYILHPIRVMLRLDHEIDKIVGVLHDVIEDSRYTLDDLLEMGFSQKILVALDHLTKRDDEPYDDYVSRTLENPIARRVKQADLLDNMDIRRMAPDLTENDWDRLQRYRQAWERLKPVSV